MKKFIFVVTITLSSGAFAAEVAPNRIAAVPPSITITVPLESPLAAEYLAKDVLADLNAHNLSGSATEFVVRAPVRFFGLGYMGITRSISPSEILPRLRKGEQISIRRQTTYEEQPWNIGQDAGFPKVTVEKGPRIKIRSFAQLLDWAKTAGIRAHISPESGILP